MMECINAAGGAKAQDARGRVDGVQEQGVRCQRVA